MPLCETPFTLYKEDTIEINTARALISSSPRVRRQRKHRKCPAPSWFVLKYVTKRKNPRDKFLPFYIRRKWVFGNKTILPKVTWLVFSSVRVLSSKSWHTWNKNSDKKLILLSMHFMHYYYLFKYFVLKFFHYSTFWNIFLRVTISGVFAPNWIIQIILEKDSFTP